MMLRDGLDLVRLLHARGGAARLEGMAAGWARAVRHLPAFAHRGPPAPPPSEVARLSPPTPEGGGPGAPPRAPAGRWRTARAQPAAMPSRRAAPRRASRSRARPRPARRAGHAR